jgi:AcrR family transcriptional regulator
MQAPRRKTRAESDDPHKTRVRSAPRSAKRKRGSGLSRETIAAAALALIDREGVDALSFRRLGQELGCEAMSLYHYFPSKAHLLDAVIDNVFGALVLPPPDRDWIGRLRKACRSYRAMALAHPRLYPLIAVHRMNTPVGVRKLDEVIGLFREAGFDDETAARLFRELGYYLTGAALDETAGYAKGPSAATPVGDAEIAAHCPNLLAAAPFFKPQHYEATFERGLDLLLDGMARLKRK